MSKSDLSGTKIALHQKLLELLSEQISTTEISIAAVIASRDNETKSSAGDKYETGRAMMQLEQQKQEGQLAKLITQRKELEMLNMERSYERVELGALVITDRGNFFIAIPVGKVLLGDEKYYSISMASPMGKALYGKSVTDQIQFKGTIEIRNIT